MLASAPPPYAAVHAVLSNEYLLEHIMLFTERCTAAVCMRVDLRFLAAAGRILYRIPPVIAAHNIESFFSGALIGLDAEELDCDGHSCPHMSGSTADHTVSASHVRADEAPAAQNPEASDSSLSPKSPARGSASLPATSPPTRRNFKRELLTHVRVFSLGSHHSCICRHYGPWRLMPKLQVLRLVPTIASRYKLEALCDAADAACTLLTSLDCEKLVLRNIGLYGLPIPDSQEWNIPSLEEVVWVVPTDCQRFYTGVISRGAPKTIDDCQKRFRNASTVKLLLHNNWEPRQKDLDAAPPFTVTGSMSPARYDDDILNVTPEDDHFMYTDLFMFFCHSIFDWRTPPRHALLVGLEGVNWDPWGILTGPWQSATGISLARPPEQRRMPFTELRQ